MPNSFDIDPETADRLLAGHPVAADADLAPVVDFLAELRAASTTPPAPVSAALAVILSDGLPGRAGAESERGVSARQPRQARRPAAASSAPRELTTWRKIASAAASGVALFAGGVTVAAATDVLPPEVGRAVTTVVETLTPFEAPKPVEVDPTVTAPSTTVSTAPRTTRRAPPPSVEASDEAAEPTDTTTDETSTDESTTTTSPPSTVVPPPTILGIPLPNLLAPPTTVPPTTVPPETTPT